MIVVVIVMIVVMIVMFFNPLWCRHTTRYSFYYSFLSWFPETQLLHRIDHPEFRGIPVKSE